MIALVASALLGLYIFLPVFFFDKLAAPFVRLKSKERTKTEEVVAGIFIAGIPFAFTWWRSRVSWHVGRYPLFLSDEAASRKITDYQVLFNGLYSEHYFEAYLSQFWDAFWRVLQHQGRFLVWNYTFLFVEICLVLIVTYNFGRLNQNPFFRKTVGQLLLRRVSEWHPLFTPFVFHPREKRRVEVDVMTTDMHLYRGTVKSHFINKDGLLTGLILKDAKRFQYSRLEADREVGAQKPIEEYWKPIPGSNLYIPYEKTVTLNLRYELPDPGMAKVLKDAVSRITGMDTSVTVQGAQLTAAIGHVKASGTVSSSEPPERPAD